MSLPCPQTSNCLPCSGIDNINVCGQIIAIDNTTGDLTITPNGNTLNLCKTVNLCETKTILKSLTLTGTVLQVVYVGEDGVQQAKSVDLAPVVADVAANFSVLDTNSIDLTYAGGVLHADLIVDPSSVIPVSASSSGVLFGAPPETPITVNSTNTLQLVASGSGGHILSGNVKYQNSASILLSSNGSGIRAVLKLSSDAGNVANFGSDGALYVQSVSSQLSSYPTNGYAITGASGTLLVGADSNLYRLVTPPSETPVTGLTSQTINVVSSGVNNHSVQATAILTNSNSISLSSTPSGIEADLRIDVGSGNVPLTVGTNGLSAQADSATVQGIYSHVATVANPVKKVQGTLNDNSSGYANVTITPYGPVVPSFTTTARLAISDAYDTLLVFDTTLRKFMWYDAVNVTWVQIG
jgi:hypothetical protein